MLCNVVFYESRTVDWHYKQMCNPLEILYKSIDKYVLTTASLYHDSLQHGFGYNTVQR